MFQEFFATVKNFMVHSCVLTRYYIFPLVDYEKVCIFNMQNIYFKYKQFKLALYFVDNTSIT